MVIRLDDAQPTFTFPPIEQIQDDLEDKPEPGQPLVIN
jgi:hypothetical protein